LIAVAVLPRPEADSRKIIFDYAITMQKASGNHGLEFKVQSSEFRVQGSGLVVWDQ
jgi:hypothetical protein